MGATTSSRASGSRPSGLLEVGGSRRESFNCARGRPAPGAVGVRVLAVNRLADALSLAVEFFDPGHSALAK